MINLIRFITVVIFYLPTWAYPQTQISLVNSNFFIGQTPIPAGCFAQLMTQLNGDNIVASIFLSRPSLRGCIDANDPYPSGDEDRVTIQAKELGENLFGIKVCEEVDGSLGMSCDRIIIKFEERDYRTNGRVKSVLAVTKIGDWE